MPAWAGKWKGGRFYFDGDGHKVFFIERRVLGRVRSVKLKTHDEELANSELVRFLLDPEAFTRPAAVPAGVPDPVYVTRERITLYLEAIRDSVRDHRAARASYLAAWSELGLDLRTVDARQMRVALASFDGGHRGRAEALNAFARFLVKLGDLTAWRPVENHRAPDSTLRAEREAYSIEQLAEAHKTLTDPEVRDVFLIRVSTGLHHTEIAQVVGVKLILGRRRHGDRIRAIDRGASTRLGPFRFPIRSPIQRGQSAGAGRGSHSPRLTMSGSHVHNRRPWSNQQNT